VPLDVSTPEEGGHAPNNVGLVRESNEIHVAEQIKKMMKGKVFPWVL